MKRKCLEYEDGEEIVTISHISSVRTVNGTKQFKAHWAGSKMFQWYEAENISRDLIDFYHMNKK